MGVLMGDPYTMPVRQRQEFPPTQAERQWRDLRLPGSLAIVLRTAQNTMQRGGWTQGTEFDERTGRMCLIGAVQSSLRNVVEPEPDVGHLMLARHLWDIEPGYVAHVQAESSMEARKAAELAIMHLAEVISRRTALGWNRRGARHDYKEAARVVAQYNDKIARCMGDVMSVFEVAIEDLHDPRGESWRDEAREMAQFQRSLVERREMRQAEAQKRLDAAKEEAEARRARVLAEAAADNVLAEIASLVERDAAAPIRPARELVGAC